MAKIVNKGTCSYCGEEMDLELLDKDMRCPDCKVDDTDDGYADLCTACNCSGEGQYEGTKCSYCHGSGITKHYTEEEEDRRDYERNR